MTEVAGWILKCIGIYWPYSAKCSKVDWIVLYSTGGQWPKTYCKSNPGVFEVKEPDRGCISLAEYKTKGRKSHKQTTEDSCSKGLAKHYEEGNQWIPDFRESLPAKNSQQNIKNEHFIYDYIILSKLHFSPWKLGTVYRLQFLKADDTRGNFLSNFARQLFLSNVAWVFSPLRMVNKFLSGYFRSVVGPVSHLVAHWWQL